MVAQRGHAEGMVLTSELRRIADDQLNVVTRPQLLQTGASPVEVRSRLARSWRLVLPGVVLLAPDLPTLDQREVAALLMDGLTSKQIGKTLNISHRTVEIYRAKLMRKYSAHTTADLIQKWMRG